MDAQAALVVSDLSKSYGAFAALAPVSFTLCAGEAVGLSGPNGSGKTTLLLCLAGLVRASSGTVSVAEFDLYRDEVEVRRRMAFIPDAPRFYSELTAWEHLQFIALAHNAGQGFQPRAEALLKRFGLWEARDVFPHHFSRGMRLKLGLLTALVRPFDVLLLDEPTSALDAEGTEVLTGELGYLCQAGKTILFSSHNSEILDQVCTRRMSLRDGALAADTA